MLIVGLIKATNLAVRPPACHKLEIWYDLDRVFICHSVPECSVFLLLSTPYTFQNRPPAPP